MIADIRLSDSQRNRGRNAEICRSCIQSAPTVVPSIDIFLSYRCNFRCSHCFIGDKLSSGITMDFSLVSKLIEECHSWSTKEVTFLGGEPTIYPQIHDAVALSHRHNLRTRIITNGSVAFHRFLDRHCRGPAFPIHIGFSLDGPQAIHDRIRKRGSFRNLWLSIDMCQAANVSYSGIVSFSNDNIDYLEETLRQSAKFGFKYLNIHYVTNRGFATSEHLISIRRWQKACKDIASIASDLRLHIRMEDTFVSQSGGSPGCAIRERTNLIFLPDGRVFQCLLFLEVPAAHSFTWSDRGLVANLSDKTEVNRAEEGSQIGCPAVSVLSPKLFEAALRSNVRVGCVYHKKDVGYFSP